MRYSRCWMVLLAALACGGAPGLPARAQASAPEASWAGAEQVVGDLYRLVTFGPGHLPDWWKVRSLFLDKAVVVLRTSRESSAIFTVDGFVQDFVDFIGRAGADRSGFTERVVRMDPTVFGDIAHVLVLYEASIPGSARPPQQGVDSFHLIRRDGRWWIVSIVNEIPAPDRPLPRRLQE